MERTRRREYGLQWMQKRRESYAKRRRHGTLTQYGAKCRCALCTDAYNAWHRKNNERMKMKLLPKKERLEVARKKLLEMGFKLT